LQTENLKTEQDADLEDFLLFLYAERSNASTHLRPNKIHFESRNKFYFFLSQFIISNNIIAPMKAVIKEVIKPSYLIPNDNEIPKRSNKNPPIKDPIHPTIMLPKIP
jgi:hypothetical protein